MKNFWIYLPVCIAFIACSDDKDTATPPVADSDDTYLSIRTEVVTRSTTVKQNFKQGDQLQVEADDVASKATYRSGKWELSPQIKLDDQEISVKAFYPHTDAPLQAVPLKVNDQQDCLYGEAKASKSNPTARLTMKHALSSLAFNIQGDGYVEKISFASSTEALFNVSTGSFSGFKQGTQTLTVGREMESSGWTSTVPDLFVLPQNGIRTLTVTIDGQDYSLAIHQPVEQAMKYIFRIVFNGKRLFLNNVEQISMNQDGDSSLPTLTQSVVTVTYQGEQPFEVLCPSLEHSMGTISWGDGSEDEYSAEAKHTYAAGSYSLTLDVTSNANECTIHSIEHAQNIDFTQF